MNILVTGANGFIGSHLVEDLVLEGHNVFSLVKPQEDISTISHLNTNVIYFDITDPDFPNNISQNIDMVFHLAAIPNWRNGISDEEYRNVNVNGTKNILELCRLKKIKRFLLTSSLEAVGPSLDGSPINENTEPHPDNIYGKTKLEAEKLVGYYNKKYQINTVTVRLPAVYGPGNLLHLKRYFKMVKTGIYPVIGKGDALMEFCYVKNAVHGIRLATEKGNAGEVYFISDERSYEFKEVVLAIAKQLNIDLKLILLPVGFANVLGFVVEVLSKVFKFYPFTFEGTGRPAFSRKTVKWMANSTMFCDVSKAKKELGYKCPFTLAQGIKENIEWYEKIGVL